MPQLTNHCLHFYYHFCSWLCFIKKKRLQWKLKWLWFIIAHFFYFAFWLTLNECSMCRIDHGPQKIINVWLLIVFCCGKKMEINYILWTKFNCQKGINDEVFCCFKIFQVFFSFHLTKDQKLFSNTSFSVVFSKIVHSKHAHWTMSKLFTKSQLNKVKTIN